MPEIIGIYYKKNYNQALTIGLSIDSPYMDYTVVITIVRLRCLAQLDNTVSND